MTEIQSYLSLDVGCGESKRGTIGIDYIAVHDDYQNMGPGMGMMKRTLDAAKTKEIRFVLVSSENDIGVH